MGVELALRRTTKDGRRIDLALRRPSFVSIGMAVFAAAMVMWTSLPYLVGYARSSPDLRFGGSFIYPQDSNSYLAKMRQGAAGAWLIHLPYTSEPHAPAPVVVLYPVLGKLAVATGLSFEATYQVARLAGAAALLAALAVFLRTFIPHRAWRRLAFALIAVSGGLGWLLSALWPHYIPLELLAPHLYVFAMLYGPPHVSFGVAVLLLMFAGLRSPHPQPPPHGAGEVSFRPLSQLWERREGQAMTIGVGVLGVALSLIRPETVPIFWVAVVGTLVAQRLPNRSEPTARWRVLKPVLLLSAAAGLPILGAVYAAVMLNPAFRVWMAQNPFPAPSPLDLALGLAPLLPLGLLALRARRWWRGPGLFVTVWALALPPLAYLPIGPQSRLLSGIVIPWGILASYGWLHVARPALRRFWRRWATVLWVGGAALSAIWFVLIAGLYVSTRPADLFYPPAAREMADWLTAHAPDRPVLSAWQTGNLLAAQGTVKVFLGHPIETLDYATKSASAQRFFQSATTAAERLSLLRRYDIAYVAYSPWERALGAFDPDSMPDLRRVFAAGGYALYQVLSP